MLRLNITVPYNGGLKLITFSYLQSCRGKHSQYYEGIKTRRLRTLVIPSPQLSRLPILSFTFKAGPTMTNYQLTSCSFTQPLGRGLKVDFCLLEGSVVVSETICFCRAGREQRSVLMNSRPPPGAIYDALNAGPIHCCLQPKCCF